MRRVAWMLVLIGLAGCGKTAPTTTTVNNTSSRDIAIPADIQELLQRREFSQAISTLTGLIERQPRDEHLYTIRSMVLHQSGRFTEAIADLDQAIALNGQDARLYNNRGFIRMGLEQFEAALADFNKATELSDKFANAYNNRGLLLIATQKFELAIGEFNRAIEINPQYIDAYNNRGFAELEAGQMEQALDDFNLAIRLDAKYVNAFNNRGLLRARAGDFENSVIDFTQAMMLDPLNPKYYQHRCEVYLRQGFVDKAIADEKKHDWLVQLHQLGANIAKSTNPAKELTQRANHYLLVDDLENAMKDLNRAIAADSRSSVAFAARAGLHLRRNSIEEAKRDAEAALSVEPLMDAYSVLGDVYLGLGDYDHAIENFARARRVDPSVAEAYYAKSKQLAEKGDAEQAKTTMQQALVLDPDIELRLR